MKKIVTTLFVFVLIFGMTIPMATPVNAATQNAELMGTSGTIYLGGSASSITDGVIAPDDGKFLQLGKGSAIQMKFPGNWYAVRDGASTPDLLIDIVDADYPAEAEISISNDGINWFNIGVKSDTANIGINLDGTSYPPIKYIKIYQGDNFIDDSVAEYADLGFDVDAVVANNAGQFWSVNVGARDNPNIPPASQLSVPISWKITFPTDPPPPKVGASNTLFSNLIPNNSVLTLDAPLTYSNGSNYYVFRQWRVGVPTNPPTGLPEQPLNQRLINIFPHADMMSMAVYQMIDFGNISYEGETINPVGISHTLWVDLAALPGPELTTPTLVGIPVQFVIQGVNSDASGVVYTNSAGKATFTYSGINPGQDQIWAYIDGNNNGSYDSGEPRSSNNSTKWWVENFVTGGGNIKESKKVAWTFAGMVGVNPEGGAIGSFEIVDHINKISYHLDQFIVLSFYGGPAESPDATNNTARFRGIGTRSDGAEVTIVIIIEDVAEPGAGADKIAVELVYINENINLQGLIGSVDVPDLAPAPPPLQQLVTITGGNFQVHNIP